ncbi:hypothetical protein O181_010239 [Austropuccinia psidii MF-1]|uniref:Integrase catalytic domain-containing protein n=1 Tax=Austropuccinia psidii MF-1 TaxID=1389203 RepID=A0A9Q3BS79_9BASI|nr:hypothetical protein [Austropuccinia psidii MF-1]
MDIGGQLIHLQCRKKTDVSEQFQLTKNPMENSQDKKLKKLISDRGGEFLNNNFKKILEECGFIHIMAPAETPQHNRFAESPNCTIIKKDCFLLAKSNLPAQFWANAVNTAVFLSNLIPTAMRDGWSPNFLWTNSPERFSKLKNFGCRAMVYNLGQHIRWKLDPPGQPGIFIGYENNNTAYRILRLTDLKVLITQHATFNKNFFPSIPHYNTGKTHFITELNNQPIPLDSCQTTCKPIVEPSPGPELIGETQLGETTEESKT